MFPFSRVPGPTLPSGISPHRRNIKKAADNHPRVAAMRLSRLGGPVREGPPPRSRQESRLRRSSYSDRKAKRPEIERRGVRQELIRRDRSDVVVLVCLPIDGVEIAESCGVDVLVLIAGGEVVENVARRGAAHADLREGA